MLGQLQIYIYQVYIQSLNIFSHEYSKYSWQVLIILWHTLSQKEIKAVYKNAYNVINLIFLKRENPMGCKMKVGKI